MEQYRKQKIAISGDLGSGKSTVAKLLGERMGAPVVSTGAFQRELAQRKGITTLELNRLAERDKSIDTEIDAISCEVEKSKDPVVIDSRLAWHFIPSAFKVYLAVDDSLAAERIFKDERDTEHPYSDANEVLNANLARRQSEVNRFRSIYGVDISIWDHFDLVVNTNAVDPEQIANAIWEQNWSVLGMQISTKYLTSPKACFPTETQAYRDIPEEPVAVIGAVYPAVDLIYVRGVNLIWGSHHDVAEAVLLKRDFIEGRIVATGEDALLPNRLPVQRLLELLPRLSEIYDWEEALRFRFYKYPSWFK